MAASSPAHLAAALFRFRKGALECGGLPGEGGEGERAGVGVYGYFEGSMERERGNIEG